MESNFLLVVKYLEESKEIQIGFVFYCNFGELLVKCSSFIIFI